jgi:hypothetical protein
MSKHKQQRTGTRAPHGAPEFTERIAFYCTAAQKRKFMKCGRGSKWVRELIDAQPS